MVKVQVFDCERRPRTISAIKYIRELRRVGLGEAKELIDEVYYHARPVVFDFTQDSDAHAFFEQMKEFGFSCRFVNDDSDALRFWFRSCPRCDGQGRLFIHRDLATGSLYLHCEECVFGFSNPLKCDFASDGFLAIDVEFEFLTKQQIDFAEWGTFAVHQVAH